jgi:hypothetical protein
MNCEEFRSQYNVWLDGRKSSPLSPEAELHGRSCTDCGTYARAMLQIDADLRNLPDVAFPEEIFAYSGEQGGLAPGRRREISYLLHSGGAVVLPALAAWIISLYLPPVWQFAMQFLLVSGAMVLFAAASLRPRFIA